MPDMQIITPASSRPGFIPLARLLCALLAPAMLASLMATPAQARPVSPPSSEEAPTSEAADPYGRDTPEGTVAGFIDALAMDNFERASVYLDLRHRLAATRARAGETLAIQLRDLLDRGGSIIPRAALSNSVSGKLDDGLEPELERVGTLRASDQEVSLLLERVEAETGDTWLVASDTLRELPGLAAAEDDTLLGRLLPQKLVDTRVGGAPLGHWLALMALAVTAYVMAWLLVGFALKADAWWCRRRHRATRSFVSTLSAPLRLWLAALLITTLAPRIGVSIVVRETFGRIIDIVALVAIAWLGWRMVDVLGGIVIRRLQGGHRSEQIISIAAFVKRLVKAVVLAIGIMAILDTMGYNITAGLAALGVGGIALALGAQKTIENLIGGVSVIADQPVRNGDYCKVGDTSGTIEELGIRSTKIRTPEDTVVVIPNSDFAAGKIENYSRRRKILLHHKINLQLRTSPQKVRRLLDGMRRLLSEHPKTRNEPPRVHLLAVGDDRLSIEVFGYIPTSDYDEFLAAQEELTLQLLDLVEREGIILAAPTTSVDAAGASPKSESVQSRDGLSRAAEPREKRGEEARG